MSRAAMVLRAAAGLVAVSAVPSLFAGWRSLGPDGAEVAALAFSVTEPGVVWAATGNGLYRSRDAGTSWALVALAGAGVRAVAVHPRDGRQVWAAFVDDSPMSVWRSEDGGTSAALSTLGVWTDRMWDLALDFADPESAYLGTDRGLFITHDGGATWSPGPGELGSSMTRTVVTAPGAVLVGQVGPQLLFMSTDHGATWSAFGLPRSLGDLAADAAGRTLWMAGWEELYLSMDGGRSWSPASGSLPPYTHPTGGLALTADGTTVLVGTNHGVFTSDDGGSTWTDRGCPPPRCPTAEDRFRPYFDPSDPERALAAVPGGVARWAGRSAPWVAANDGLRNTTVHAIRVAADGTLWVATYAQGIFRSEDGGATWDYAGGTLPYGMWREEAPPFYVTSLTEIDGGMVAGTTLGVRATRDGGTTWGWLGGSQGTVLGFLQDPSRTATLIEAAVSSGLTSGGLYVSPDGGATWTEKLDHGSAWAVAGDAAGEVMLAIGSARGEPAFQGVLRSTDHGETWAGVLAEPYVLALAAGLPSPGRFWAAGNSVFRSDDGGSSWVEVGALPPCVAYSSICMARFLVLDEAQRRLFAGASDRIFESRDGGASWQPLAGPGLPSPAWHGGDYTASMHALTALGLDPAGRVLAGVVGRGLYVLEPDVRVPRRRLSR